MSLVVAGPSVPLPHPSVPSVPPFAVQVEEFQVIVGSTVTDVSASCPAEGTAGHTAKSLAGAAPAPSQEGGGEVTLECQAPSGGRTNNRDIQPVGNRTVLVSAAA